LPSPPPPPCRAIVFCVLCAPALARESSVRERQIEQSRG
jgi:hypothetical protein